MNEENVAIRLKGFIDQSGLTSSQFADQCGIPRPSLSQILSGRNKKISDVIVGLIHQAFPDLNILWLLFGEGDMLVSASHGNKEGVTERYGEEGMQSPNAIQDQVYENIELGSRETSGLSSKLSSRQQALLEKRIAELEEEVRHLKKNPRKVSQITVYYDDSTFETFIPSQRK